MNLFCKTQRTSCKTLIDQTANYIEKTTEAGVAKLVDATDLKSLDGADFPTISMQPPLILTAETGGTKRDLQNIFGAVSPRSQEGWR
jgi:hypothetical protein